MARVLVESALVQMEDATETVKKEAAARRMVQSALTKIQVDVVVGRGLERLVLAGIRGDSTYTACNVTWRDLSLPLIGAEIFRLFLYLHEY